MSVESTASDLRLAVVTGKSLQCCTAFYFDRESGVLYHFSAISAAGSYKDIIGILQWSTDCGETFTEPKIIWPDHGTPPRESLVDF